MNTTIKKYIFSPSVNIIRDNALSLNYIPTPNSIQVFSQITNDYKIGIRVFNLVGAYGIGKSAFLWALENDFEKRQNYFNAISIAKDTKDFKVIRFIGSYNSFQADFAKYLSVPSDSNSYDVFKALKLYIYQCQKENVAVVIFVDEFGKYLEYAAKNNPEKELHFIQELAEFINDLDKEIILISTLHQDFNRYSDGLTKSQQNEWDKVKGRLKEITFNEPVEQLLFLAAGRIKQFNFKNEANHFHGLFEILRQSKLFPLKDYFNTEIANDILPFDILSSAVLTLALQKYGQNERSLFSFLESNDPYNLFDYNSDENPYYNLACVYDYLIYNYYSLLSSKFNPNFSNWANMRIAIEKIEGLFDQYQIEAIKIIKSIGLLNIFATASGKIDDNFINNYSKYALGIENAPEILELLMKNKVLRFVAHIGRYTLAYGTDLDIELAIRDAALEIQRPSNIVQLLNDYFNFNYLPAKAVQYQKGTPRFFQIQLLEEPIVQVPHGEVDGYIQLIFSGYTSAEKVKSISANCQEAILYGHYTNTVEIENALFEILKINKVINENPEDKIALTELEIIKNHFVKKLNVLVLNGLFSNDDVKWFYSGVGQIIPNARELNRKISNISNEIYDSTPVFLNEMVNRTKLSSPISTARKSLIKNVVENWNRDDLGYYGTSFPPDRTIYLSLLKATGLHKKNESGNTLQQPTDLSYSNLWEAGMIFINSTRHSERNLQDFVDLLLAKPFKLKKGFIDFWLPIFLFANRDDFALYGISGYIPDLTTSNLDILVKTPKDYHIKAFDVEGVKLQMFNKYRVLLEQSERDSISNQSFIDITKPFLKFYKDLNDFSKTSTRISNNASALRGAIAVSKDPEKTFFEDFPAAMGFNILQLQNEPELLENYIKKLQDSIRELKDIYPLLIDRVEAFMKNDVFGENIDFENFASTFEQRYAKIRINLLKSNQRILYQRLISRIDDRSAWLNSIAFTCLGKNLNQFRDSDEALVYEKILSDLRELDNICEINVEDFNSDNEEIFKIEITSFIDGLQKQLVRWPKDKTKEITLKESQLKGLLGSDKSINIAVLTNLLQKELGYGKD